MPTGFWDSLNGAARFIEWMQPKRVLDVGIGNGRMGFLAREYGNKEGIPRWRPGEQVVDGIEGYAPYLGAVQEVIYDSVFVGDALDILPSLAGQYELVLASDILEHFTEDLGLRFVALSKAAGNVLFVATPNFDMSQKSDANPLENHRSFWPPDALRKSGAIFVEEGQLSTVALFGDAQLVDEYVATVRHEPAWKDWVLPPKIRRFLHERRVRLSG